MKGDLKAVKRGWPLKKKEGIWRTGRSLRSSAESSAAAGRGDLDDASRETESICKAITVKHSPSFISFELAALESLLPFFIYPFISFFFFTPSFSVRVRVRARARACV